MKKLTTCILIVIFAFLCTNEACARWIEVGNGDDVGLTYTGLLFWYMDDEVKDNGDYCSVRIKETYGIPKQSINGKYFMTIATLAFPLVKNKNGGKTVNTQKFATLSTICYDRQGYEVDSFTKKTTNWQNIKAGTLIAKTSPVVAKFYNKKYNPHTYKHSPPKKHNNPNLKIYE